MLPAYTRLGLSFLAFFLPIFAQTAIRLDPTPVFVTNGSTPPGSYAPMFAVPGAAIQVCTDAPCSIRATTFTDGTGGTACPTTAQVVLAGKLLCQPTTDALGNFGFWITPGAYWYKVTLPSGTVYGPYPISPPGATWTSPMSAAGDMIVGGAAGVPIRLATPGMGTFCPTWSASGVVTWGACPAAGLTVFNYGAKGDGATDDTAAIQAAINAACPVGGYGGSVFFPIPTVSYLVLGKLTFQNSGPPDYIQSQCRLYGAGRQYDLNLGMFGAIPVGGSRIDMRYNGPGGKIDLLGHGEIEIDHLAFVDGSTGNTTPFIEDINTISNIHDNSGIGSVAAPTPTVQAFVAYGGADLHLTTNAVTNPGASNLHFATLADSFGNVPVVGQLVGYAGISTAGSGTTVTSLSALPCAPTCVVALSAPVTAAGVTNAQVISFGQTTEDGTIHAPFRGYGSVAERNHLSQMIGFELNSQANGIVISHNEIGYGTKALYAINLEGSGVYYPTSGAFHNNIDSNLIETGSGGSSPPDGYLEPIRMNYSSLNSITTNGCWDGSLYTTTCVKMELFSPNNNIILGMTPNPQIPPVIDLNGNNFISGSFTSQTDSGGARLTSYYRGKPMGAYTQLPALPKPPGSEFYCTNCGPTAPCTPSGSGTMAFVNSTGHEWDCGSMQILAFHQLPTPSAGAQIFCTDCMQTQDCWQGGTGAMAIANTAIVSLVTNAPSLSGSSTLYFASTVGLMRAMVASGANIPTGYESVTALTPTSVTLNIPITGNIGIGATINFQVWWQCAPIMTSMQWSAFPEPYFPGQQVYCTDCVTAATCTSGGTGHVATANGAIWTCQ